MVCFTTNIFLANTLCIFKILFYIYTFFRLLIFFIFNYLFLIFSTDTNYQLRYSINTKILSLLLWRRLPFSIVQKFKLSLTHLILLHPVQIIIFYPTLSWKLMTNFPLDWLFLVLTTTLIKNYLKKVTWFLGLFKHNRIFQ